jgi:Glycosyl transferase family 11
MKLVVRQQSGLGNQMFQYAAGLYYAATYNAALRMAIDLPKNAISHGSPRPFLLSHFAISAPYRELTKIEELLLLTEHRRLKPVGGAMLQRTILENGLRLQIIPEGIEHRFRFRAALPIKARTQTIFLVGYWQVHNIADAIASDVRREFAFREAPNGKNLEVLRRIKDARNSVSLHIRRGDYTLDAEGNVALPIDYYSRAIADLKSSLRDPTFFVFSDDIEFARRSLRAELSSVFVDHNDSFSAHEDLRLMSSCRHHIIANSTFSWWAAWLGTDATKIVIAPRRWMVGNCPPINDLFPSAWRLLE